MTDWIGKTYVAFCLKCRDKEKFIVESATLNYKGATLLQGLCVRCGKKVATITHAAPKAELPFTAEERLSRLFEEEKAEAANDLRKLFAEEAEAQ